MHRAKRIRLCFTVVFRSLLLLAGVIAILRSDWIYLMLSWVTLFLTFLPSLIAREYRFDIPNEFETAILVFIYASLYLGEMHYFYTRLWWWDVFLHAFAAMIMGAIGFMLVSILNRETRVAIRLSPFFVAVFSWSFAVSLGALWEIIEFSLDAWFGLNMQKTGLVDTMWDLIVDALGALVVSYLGYVYMHKDIRFFSRLEERLLTDDNI